jgi:hypothetical protein
MYLFGGSNLERENTKFYALNLKSYVWEVVKSRGDLPITRDSHTAVVNDSDDTMIVFGGYMNCSRTNEVIIYSFSENRWS